jgi:phosphatidylglycerol:prolipoprotein diacylglycerol transferase
MSFFGAILGALAGIYFSSKKHTISFLSLSDVVVTCVPLGLGLGRLANMINSECLGKISTWGLIFPLVDMHPRYPTQIIEAVLEGCVMALVLRTIPYAHKGQRCAYFLMIYAIIRLCVEPYKEQEALWSILSHSYNPSVILALVCLILGIFLLKKESS